MTKRNGTAAISGDLTNVLPTRALGVGTLTTLERPLEPVLDSAIERRIRELGEQRLPRMDTAPVARLISA